MVYCAYVTAVDPSKTPIGGEIGAKKNCINWGKVQDLIKHINLVLQMSANRVLCLFRACISSYPGLTRQVD